MIDPQMFMTRTEAAFAAYGNVVNPKLRALWYSLGLAFNASVADESSDTWRIVPACTGSGKTLGAQVYSAMLSAREDRGPGVLFVTRLIRQAREAAAVINKLAAEYGVSDLPVALDYHSENRVPTNTLAQYPILVITHAAFEISLDKVNRGIDGAYEHLTSYGTSRRGLHIVDESLDIVQEASVDLQRLRVVESAIPVEVLARHPKQRDLLQAMIRVLSEVVLQIKPRDQWGPEVLGGEVPLYQDGLIDTEYVDMTPLRRELRGLRLDRTLMQRNAKHEGIRLAASHDQILRDLQDVVSQWAWYLRKIGGRHTLTTARRIIPDDIRGAVVLDATAKQDVVYRLFDKAHVVKLPAHPRIYANLEVKFVERPGAGKEYLRSHIDEEVPPLMAALAETLPPESKVLVICSADVEPAFAQYLTSKVSGEEEIQPTPFAAFDVGHWNALDGLNVWSDFDTIVIFGLPYRDRAWAANTFQALRSPQDARWLNTEDRPFTSKDGNTYRDVRKALATGRIVCDVVQAINRGRPRRVVDVEGNCGKSRAFVVTGERDRELAYEIMRGLEEELPQVNVTDPSWPEYEAALAQGAALRRPRRMNHEEAIYRWIAGQSSSGYFEAREIRGALNIPPAPWKYLAGKMSDPTSRLAKRLANIGVIYLTRREGRTERAYLVKDGG